MPEFSRRHFLGGAGAAVAGAVVAPVLTAAPALAVTPADPNTVYADLTHHWWDPNTTQNQVNMARIRPTNGGDPESRNGLIDNSLSRPSFWQMAQYHNVVFWQWKLTGAAAEQQKIRDQWAYVRRVWPASDLGGDGRYDGTINASDDAGWKALYLMQVHQATGDAAALSALISMIPATLRRYRDPDTTQITSNGLSYSPYGILYASYDQPEFAAHQFGVSSLYEVQLALAALYVFQVNGNTGYRDYAVHTYNWVHQYLKHPAGYYEADLDIKPYQLYGTEGLVLGLATAASAGATTLGLSSSVSGIRVGSPVTVVLNSGNYLGNVTAINGTTVTISPALPGAANVGNKVRLMDTATSNTGYRKGVGLGGSPGVGNDGTTYGKPVRGNTTAYGGGTLGVGTLAARLYQIDPQSAYLAEVNSIVGTFTNSNAFGRPGTDTGPNSNTVICNARDPWTEGTWYQAFAYYALKLPGVDLNHTFKAALQYTSANIANLISPDPYSSHGFYGADWSGPENDQGGLRSPQDPPPTDTYDTWEARYRAKPGSQAGAEQIMTSSSSASVVQAAALA